MTDLESTVYDTDKWHKAPHNIMHYDYEDGTYYLTVKVRNSKGLAIVDLFSGFVSTCACNKEVVGL